MKCVHVGFGLHTHTHTRIDARHYMHTAMHAKKLKKWLFTSMTSNLGCYIKFHGHLATVSNPRLTIYTNGVITKLELSLICVW